MASRGLPALRSFLKAPRCRVSFPSSSRCMTTSAAENAKTDATSPLPPAARPASTDARINNLVDEISGLTLLQAADLVAALKTRLNIQEIAAPVAAAPAAAPAAAEAEEAPAAEKPKEKTVFNVKLESFEATAKPKIIREIKAIVPNLNLIEAKKFVESVPKTVKENLTKEEAEKLKKTLEDLGAKVVLE